MEEYDVATMQCRSCLSSSSNEYIDMESSMAGDYSYLECFNICTQLKASNADNLPVTMCTACSHDLQIAFDFVQAARQADAELRDNLMNNVRKNYDEMERLEYVESIEEGDGEEVEEEHVLELHEVEEELDEMATEECTQMEIIQEHLDQQEEEVEQLEYRELETVDEQMLDDTTIESESFIVEKPETVVVELESTQTKQPVTRQRSAAAVKVETHDAAASYPQDEVDDEYLIEYSEADDAASTAQHQGAKWRCIECKRVLRGDVSYEGHMNMHKNVKPYKCTQCKSAFRCKVALERHASKRHEPSKTQQKCFSCDLCTQVFRLATLLLEHRRVEHKTLEACGKCSKSFNTKDSLAEHMTLIHPPTNTTPIECPYCDQQQQPPVSLTRTRLIDHLRTQHPAEHRKHLHTVGRPCDENRITPWQCEECFRYYRTEALLKDHRNTHTNERPHACNICDKRYFTASNLRSHIRSMHPLEYEQRLSENSDAMVQCELCKKRLLQKNLEKHMTTHERKQKDAAEGSSSGGGGGGNSEPVKFLCAYCPRECKNQKTLTHHEKLHQSAASGISYNCVDCERNYATLQHLEQHRKQAHKERDHVCAICGNAFKLKNQLLNHMKLHLEKNIQCPHCDKKYARQFDLNVHLRSHTGEQPYACTLCDKRFAIKVRLTYHLQKHMGVKHRCKECGAEFNSKQKLKAHSYKHTGMPYRCETCDNHGFANRDVFKRHLLRVHNTTMTDEALVEMFQRNTGKTTRIRPIDEIDSMVLKNEDQHLVENVEERYMITDEIGIVEEVILS